ncbi:1,5-anhydro-D-fructose reductase-like isoform X2 [Culicoides brevitarsis]
MVLPPTVKLNNGHQMPVIGLGTYLAKNKEGVEAVKVAVDAGYRHFDTAYFYGNEKEVGEGLRAKISDGTVKREDLFVVTKLWNCFHDPKHVETAFQKSLENLNLDYIDLYLMHMPIGYEFRGYEEDLFPTDAEGNLCFSDVDYLDTWKAMEKLMATGKVRSLGISNFNSKQITRLLEVATVKPVTNQVECYLQLTQKKLTKFCKDLDIVITAYSPMGRPHDFGTNPNIPKPALEDERVKEIAKKYGKTTGQVILKYLIQELGVVPIPKSSNTERIKQNIDIFDFTLTPEDCKTLASLDNNVRTNPFNLCKKHKYYPFNEEF